MQNTEKKIFSDYLYNDENIHNQRDITLVYTVI